MPPDLPEEPTDATSARPVRADVTTTATAGGVLVAVTLRNDTAVDVRVRVENDLEGPVLPPRREGVPAAGWDEEGFTGVVPASGRLGIGYACPSAGDGGGTADDEDTVDGGGVDETKDADSVGSADTGSTGGGGTDGDATDPTPADADPSADPAANPISVGVLGPPEGTESEVGGVADAVRSLGRAAPPADAVPSAAAVDSRHAARGGAGDPSDVPTDVAAWLDAIEARIRRAERLTGATADGAAAVLEDRGGVDGIAGISDEIEHDLEALRAAGDRIGELSARAAAVDPEPVVSSLVDAADGAASGDGAGGPGETARRGDETINDPEERR